jgi:hypothetical protein
VRKHFRENALFPENKEKRQLLKEKVDAKVQFVNQDHSGLPHLLQNFPLPLGAPQLEQTVRLLGIYEPHLLQYMIVTCLPLTYSS